MNTRNIFILLIAGACAAADAWFIRAEFLLGDHTVSRECGPMENLQAVTCGLAALVFLAAAIRATRWRELTFFLALLLANFVFREVDLDDPKLGVHYAIIYFVQGPGRSILLGPLWLWLVWKIFRRARGVAQDFITFASTTTALIFASGMAFGLGSEIFDAIHDKNPKILFLEEIMEVNGYGLLLISAAHHNPAAPVHVRWIANLVRKIFPKLAPPA